MTFTAVSLFSGCGGFDLGARRAGLDITWANDSDPAAATAYRALHPDVNFHEGDVRTVERFPEADVLIGCYPCTGFSIAARRRGADDDERRDLRGDTRNFLYREFLRALRQVRPRFFFVENVKGMITASDGWFLRRQIESFRRLGYRVTSQLVNASSFGLPQERRRLFLVGTPKTVRYAFPEPTFGTSSRPARTLRDSIFKMPRWPIGEFPEHEFTGHYLSRNRKRSWDATSFTIVANMRQAPLHPMGRPMRNLAKDSWCLQGVSNRRLSWRECAKLQGLPLEPFNSLPRPTGFATLGERYRVVGNAVPPELGRVIVAAALELA